MSRISQADKQRMYDLAVEIIEHKRESPNDYMGACKLYDQTDEEWNAERIKSLLDELKETQAQLQTYKHQPMHGMTARKLFTCSSCEAEGLDEPLESKCHCMGDDAHWIESVIYQPEKPNGPTA